MPNKFIHEVNNLLERIIIIKSIYSRVISPLMQPSKWVQSIECGGDWCFICTLPSSIQWQTFLPFLGHVSGGLHSQNSAIPGMYQYPWVPRARRSSWVLWLRYHVCSEDYLTKLPRCAPFVLISSHLFLSSVCMLLSLVSRPPTVIYI